MNIGMVCYPSHGGSGVVATELSKQLSKRGHQVHLISFSLPLRISQRHDNIWFHRVEVSAYPLFKYPPYSLEVTAMIADVAKNHLLDLVHVHYAIPHGMSAWCAQVMLAEEGIRLPFVTTLHGTDITVVGSEPSMAPVTCFILRHSDAVTTVSKWLAEETRRFFQVHRELDVIPNFIDTAAFKRRPTPGFRDCLATPGEKLLLHISNFRPVKNVPDIVNAFAAIQREIPCRLTMVGDGPERQHVEQLVRSLGLSARVHFAGTQANVMDFLSVADLYLMASETESFGLSALEAMSCGVPVVAYRVGGMPEVIQHGETGLFAEPHDVAGLARAATELLTDPPRQRRMARAARRRAMERFTVGAIVPMYEQVYDRVTRGGRPTPVCLF